MIIETNRLQLVPLTPRNINLWISDIKKLEEELNCKYMAEPMEGFFKEIVKGQAKITNEDPENYLWHSFWFLIRKSDRVVVGSLDFKDVPNSMGEVEIGYGLGKAFEKNGYMTEAVKAMCDWSFNNDNVKYIIAETDNEGYESQKILKRCGFKQEGFGKTSWWRLEEAFFMNINIRNIQPKDYRRLEEIAREAFWNLYFPGCEEHYVIHKMRKHKDYISDLSYLIELNNEIVGGIFYTNSKVKTEDKKEYNTVTFGPVFIDPKYHRKGLGKALITHSIDAARKAGYIAILTLGYPYQYEIYGFLGGKKYGICMEDGKFYKGLLVLPLYETALKGINGMAVFSDVYNVGKEEVALFDKTFIPKEKKVTESQMEFEIASTMLDD